MHRSTGKRRLPSIPRTALRRTRRPIPKRRPMAARRLTARHSMRPRAARMANRIPMPGTDTGTTSIEIVARAGGGAVALSDKRPAPPALREAFG